MCVLRFAMTLGLAMALPLSASAGPAPMTAAEFEAYVTGLTITYSYGDSYLGTEQYKADRKVVWALTGDQCRAGHWYAQDQEICFVYENLTVPQCWLFYQGAAGLMAQRAGHPEAPVLHETGQTPGPLSCGAAAVGV
jgi:hypothetical protein